MSGLYSMAPSKPQAWLGPQQHADLLSIIRTHLSLIDDAKLDATREQDHQLRPTYILDFSELLRLLQRDATVYSDEDALALPSLLTDPDVALVLGPGTIIEIVRHYRMVEPEDSGGDNFGQLLSQYRKAAESLESAVPSWSAELNSEQRQIDDLISFIVNGHLALWSQYFSDDSAADFIHQPTFQLIIRYLTDKRPDAPDANRADAFNYAAVVRRQQDADAGAHSERGFPYLLSHTTDLLRFPPPTDIDSHAELLSYRHAVVRTPAEAAYSALAARTYPEPGDRFDTLENLEKSLRAALSFLVRNRQTGTRHEAKMTWPEFLRHGRTALTPTQVRRMRPLRDINHPMVFQSSSDYDAARGWYESRQGTQAPALLPTMPSQFIRHILLLLDSANRTAEELFRLLVQTPLPIDIPNGKRFVYQDAFKATLLTTDIYPTHVTLSWDTTIRATRVFDHVMQSLRDHAANDFRLLVCTEDTDEFGLPSAYDIDASLPLRLSDVYGAVRYRPVQTITIFAGAFDIILSLPSATRLRLNIGISGVAFDAEHLAKFLQQTSPPGELAENWGKVLVRSSLDLARDQVVAEQSGSNVAYTGSEIGV